MVLLQGEKGKAPDPPRGGSGAPVHRMVSGYTPTPSLPRGAQGSFRLLLEFGTETAGVMMMCAWLLS
jgi:hypothetical protein